LIVAVDTGVALSRVDVATAVRHLDQIPIIEIRVHVGTGVGDPGPRRRGVCPLL